MEFTIQDIKSYLKCVEEVEDKDSRWCMYREVVVVDNTYFNTLLKFKEDHDRKNEIIEEMMKTCEDVQVDIKEKEIDLYYESMKGMEDKG
jgi:hypothetical protein